MTRYTVTIPKHARGEPLSFRVHARSPQEARRLVLSFLNKKAGFTLYIHLPPYTRVIEEKPHANHQ